MNMTTSMLDYNIAANKVAQLTYQSTNLSAALDHTENTNLIAALDYTENMLRKAIKVKADLYAGLSRKDRLNLNKA